jgi:hypothetical protein
MVQIIVGPEQKLFVIHEDLLCRVEYFKSAFKGFFKESNDKMIVLPEDDPIAFSEVVNWVYGHKYECKSMNCKPGEVPQTGHIIPHCEVFVLADKYGIRGLENMCINACINCYPVHRKSGIDYTEVNYIYDHTLPGSRLRRCAVDMLVETVFSRKSEAGRKIRTWRNVRSLTYSAGPVEFDDDCKFAIQHHASRVGPHECDIEDCRYHDWKPEWDFLFASAEEIEEVQEVQEWDVS